MAREITDHKVNAVNDGLIVRAMDEPGSGGAHHIYNVSGFTRILGQETPKPGMSGEAYIWFQNGPIKEAGVNGLTHEVLLAIVIDRLRAFQAGLFASSYNAMALRSCEDALFHLKSRTRERQARGVEGTHQV